MTIRSVVLGLLLGAGISAATYYNDWIIRGPSLVMHLLPISVVGFALLLLLVVNPLVWRFGRRWTFRGAEVAVIVTIGLASCAWPGAGFFRTATTNLVMPARLGWNAAHWQASQALAYVPGRADMLANGHVRDWPELVRRLVAGRSTETDDPLAAAIWERIDEVGRLRFLAAAESPDLGRRSDLANVINQAIAGPPWIEPADLRTQWITDPLRPLVEEAERGTLSESEAAEYNRRLLSAAMPDLVLPPPSGEGVLFLNGRYDRSMSDAVINGRQGDQQATGLELVPWGAWWPSIRLWWPAALLTGAAVLCLAVIVHPQWSRRELLAYPIPRFFDEMLHRSEDRRLPDVTANRFFWGGAIAVFILHAINFAHVWLPVIPPVPRRIDLTPLLQLFPPSWLGLTATLRGELYFTVVALAFFLNRSVSFSVGIASAAYVALSAFMIERGLTLQSEYLGAGESNMLRFGAYLAMAGIVAYLGRRYYLNILRGAVGLGRRGDVEPTGIWAARMLAVVSCLFVIGMQQAGLSWSFAAALWALILLTFLVLSRITAETGMFFIQPHWMPVGVLTALLGFEAIGPTTFIILALASTMIVGDVRTALMANLVNGLRVADGQPNVTIRRLLPWISVMIVVGFFIAAAATLWTQYNHGLLNTNGFTNRQLPSMPFDELSKFLSEAEARNTLAAAAQADGQLNVSAINPRQGTWLWMSIGAALVVGCSYARMKFTWWPLHPVIFVLWGTFPVNAYGFSFLVGWLVKAAVVAFGGERGYRMIIPLMVGIVAGEIFFSFATLGLDAVYYFQTGLTPPRYSVFLPS